MLKGSSKRAGRFVRFWMAILLLLVTTMGCDEVNVPKDEKDHKKGGKSRMSASDDSQQSKRVDVKRRRVIFNCDGDSVFVEAGGDLNKWIQNIFTGLENSHVDALFWCDGAGGNTASYASKVLELTGQRIGKVSPFLQRLIDEGNDPPEVVVREAKKRGMDVFYSFRINDIHDDFTPGEFPTFKKEHPEWMIGPGHLNVYKTALNFAIPEVRRLKFAVIEEILQKYDFDGLEIDFMRSPTFFIPGEEPENAHILTQFLRDVRQHLNQRGNERGRRIELAVRVDENLKACQLDGFDVSTWAKEGLTDILILGSGVIDIEVEEFKELVKNTGIPVYACLYGWPSNYNPISTELARGLAMNYWYQKADGIYLFNWFPHSPESAYQISLLREIGDPAMLRGKNKCFAADRGEPDHACPHNWLRAVLPVTVAEGEEVTIPIMIGEELSKPPVPKKLELHLECKELSDKDSLKIQLNKSPLPEGTRAGSRVTISISPDQVKLGRNQVGIAVNTGQVAVTALEIHVSYGK